MSGSVPRNRRAPASICRKPRPEPAIRHMELIGCLPDGTLFVWQQKGLVRPIDRLPMNDGRIVSGHYIIEHRGCAVVVHLSTVLDGSVTVQQMDGRCTRSCVSHRKAEEMLLGQVVRSEAEKEQMRRLFADLRDDRERECRAPHLRRGRAGA